MRQEIVDFVKKVEDGDGSIGYTAAQKADITLLIEKFIERKLKEQRTKFHNTLLGIKDRISPAISATKKGAINYHLGYFYRDLVHQISKHS